MKFVHLSDLHFGKRVNEYSLLEDQRYIVQEILNIIDNEQPDGILLAGDIYDKPMPSTEAVELFDEFLVQLSRRNLQVFLISGNHDSPERLSFGCRLMESSGIHIAPVYHGKVSPVPIRDNYGVVNVWMLPFVKPAHVRRFFPEQVLETYTDAIRTAIAQMGVDFAERNVLLTHQFVTGATRSESEELSIGGSDNVDGSVFEGFDYVALGHIHGSQNVGSEKIRYCGTPLKYSFSEATHQKSVTVVEMEEKGQIAVRTVPLIPKRDLVEIKGTYMKVTSKSFYENTSWSQDYVHITLTDEEDITDAIGKLRVIYPNLMKLDYDNTRTRQNTQLFESPELETQSPLELFAKFYYDMNNSAMSEEQTEFVRAILEEIREEKV